MEKQCFEIKTYKVSELDYIKDAERDHYYMDLYVDIEDRKDGYYYYYLYRAESYLAESVKYFLQAINRVEIEHFDPEKGYCIDDQDLTRWIVLLLQDKSNIKDYDSLLKVVSQFESMHCC